MEALESRQLLDGSKALLFDFGPSGSLAEPGYAVVGATAYDPDRGYGWDSTHWLYTGGNYGAGADALDRDFAYGFDRTFQADLPDGTYDVTPILGAAATPRDRVAVWIEGWLVASGIATAAGQFSRQTYQVQVADGQLDLRIADGGGVNHYFSIAGLEIKPVGALPVPGGRINAGPDQITTEGSLVTFSATATSDRPLSYHWDFGDGSAIDGPLKTTHTYRDNGTYTATLTATGADGTTTRDTAIITVRNVAPSVSIGVPSTASAGSAIAFQATANDPSPIDQDAGFTYRWDFGDGSSGNGPAPSHSYTKAGTYTIGVTATDKDGATSMLATAAITVVVGVGSLIPIDAAWLAARGTGPYLLDQAGATYKLMTDVTVPGTAFIAAAKDVTLDLNGHTVTYDQSAPITVPNGGFEEGADPAAVPGWDTSQAPTARRVPARTGMWGDRMLQLENITTTQVIQSDPIPIPQAGQEYAAAITPKGPYGTTVKLSVVDAVTGKVLASGTSRNPDRGFSAVVQFTPTTTDAVRLRVEVAPPAGKTATVDLDYAALTRSRNYGIVGTYASWILPEDLLTDAVKSGMKTVADFTVKNGAIQQGSGRSYAGSPIFARTARGITVDDVEATASGMDTDHIEARYASNVEVKNSHLIGDLDRISNRMLLFAAVQLANSSGTISVLNNVIEGRMHIGVSIYRSDQAIEPVTIRGNEMRIDTLGTDGYGIFINNLKNFEIDHNTIVPVNGRGILIDGFSNGITRDGSIHDNHVEARERPNLEYGANAMEATALRMRNYNGSHRNLRITDNTFVAYTGPGGDWAAIGARISATNDAGQMTGADNVFENNTFKAIVTATDPTLPAGKSSRAWGLTLSGVGAGTGMVFRNNVIESNDISLNFGDNDSYGRTDEDLTFIGNTIRKSSDGAAMDYQGIVVGDWKNTVSHIRLIDMRYENGATSDIRFLGADPKDVSIGRLLDVAVTTPAGAPAAGATVHLLDKNGKEIFSGTTDAQGRIGGIAVVTSVIRQTGTDPSVLQTETRGPFTIKVESGTRQATQTFEMTSNLKLTLQLA